MSKLIFFIKSLWRGEVAEKKANGYALQVSAK